MSAIRSIEALPKIGGKIVRGFANKGITLAMGIHISVRIEETAKRLGVKIEDLPKIGIESDRISFPLLVESFNKKGIPFNLEWRKDEPQNVDTLCAIVLGIQRDYRYLEFDQAVFNTSQTALLDQELSQIRSSLTELEINVNALERRISGE